MTKSKQKNHTEDLNAIMEEIRSKKQDYMGSELLEVYKQILQIKSLKTKSESHYIELEKGFEDLVELADRQQRIRNFANFLLGFLIAISALYFFFNKNSIVASQYSTIITAIGFSLVSLVGIGITFITQHRVTRKATRLLEILRSNLGTTSQ